MQTTSIYIAGQRLEWIVAFTKSLEMEDLVLAFQNSLQGRVFAPATGTTVSCPSSSGDRGHTKGQPSQDTIETL